MSKAHVAIIGGGFAGIAAAKIFAAAPKKHDLRVTIIDRNNHHLFQPLLYQVATAGLTPANIAYPIRSVMRRFKQVTTLMGEVTGINPNARTITLDQGESISFDYLLIAAGATHSYFGHDAWASQAPGLKTVDDATEIRKRILLAFESAEREPNPHLRSAYMTFVIVGGGPTGVELAGAIAELALKSIAKDFRSIDPRGARIVLIEAGPRVLASFDPLLSDRAKLSLERLGVEILLNQRVTDIRNQTVICGDTRIRAVNVIWAAGVAASPLGKSVSSHCDSAGRVRVNPDLSVPEYSNIFVAGDLACVTRGNKNLNDIVPGVAPAAIQEGRHAAKNILRLLEKKTTRRFSYLDKGQLATIGKNAAIAQFGSLRVSGYFAWITWVGVHIFFLIDFRNRIMVMIDWFLAYVTFRKGARLITGTKTTIPKGRT